LCGKVQKKCQLFRKKYFTTPKASTKINTNPEIQIFVRQLIRPEIQAKCLRDFIVTELEKRIPFRRVLRLTQERAQHLGQIRGLRIQISGRLNGADIARTEWIRIGRVPLQILSADLNYSNKTASTIYGLLGVKVWLFCLL
jgi:small subunit ribosomal protein S3